MLKKYDPDIHIDNKTKYIIGFGHGTAYIEEFFVCYKDIESRFVVFLNDNAREQKTIDVDGTKVEVRDHSYFKDISDEKLKDSVIVILDDYYREVYESICSIPEVENYRDRIYYFANKETEIEESYRNKYKDTPLENIIVFRSGPHPSQYVKGMDFSDNARAVFEYMLSAGLNEKYELVWFVKDPSEFERYKDVKNVSFLSYEWASEGSKADMDSYYRALCLSKCLFFTDAYGFARNCREDQVRIQLWHGCGFKTRVNFTRCEKRYEYMPVISPLYKEVHERIYGLRSDQVIITGYPKQDWLFHPIEGTLKEHFNIKEASKYIFWLPTFRESEGSALSNLNEYSIGGDTGLPVADSREKLSKLNEVLSRNDMVLVIKLHPFQKRSAVNCEGFSNISIIENSDLRDKDIEINKILAKSDALISDYSSAAIDYLILNRPMAFVIEDVEEYSRSRGFVFDPVRDYFPGSEIFTFEDMLTFVDHIANGEDPSKEKREALRKKMHTYGDDQSSKRIIEFLGI